MIKKIWTYSAKILQFPFIVIALSINGSNKSFLRNVANEKLSDKYTNEDIEELAKLVEKDVHSANI